MKIKLHPLFIIAAVASIMVSACTPTIIDNNYHLPRKTMQKLLLDINVAEAYSIVVKDSLHRAGTKNIDSLAVYYKDILAHYSITETQFEQSLDWYKNNPEELDSIYNNNLQIVTRWQAHPPLSKRDSVTKGKMKK